MLWMFAAVLIVHGLVMRWGLPNGSPVNLVASGFWLGLWSVRVPCCSWHVREQVGSSERRHWFSRRLSSA